MVVATLKSVRQPFVVDTQAMQSRRIEVVDVDRILDDVAAKILAFTIGNPRFDPPAGHPYGEQQQISLQGILPSPLGN